MGSEKRSSEDDYLEHIRISAELIDKSGGYRNPILEAVAQKKL